MARQQLELRQQSEYAFQQMGKMVGIGWFTSATGERNIVDLRKKKGS